MVDAALIAEPRSTNNADGERDPQMHQTQKGNDSYFGMNGTHRRRCCVGVGPHGWATP